jgi:hypothetical protein
MYIDLENKSLRISGIKFPNNFLNFLTKNILEDQNNADNSGKII